MINAGAIATTSLVRGVDRADRLRCILRMFDRYTVQAKTVDHPVYQSEKNTGHHNRAIGHMLRNFAILADDPESVLDHRDLRGSGCHGSDSYERWAASPHRAAGCTPGVCGKHPEYHEHLRHV